MNVARQVFSRKAKFLGVSVDQWADHFVLGLSHEAPDVEDNVLYDGQIADRGIEALRELRDRPFSLALGFIRPHLPFIAPKKYWDMYPPESVKAAARRFQRANDGDCRLHLCQRPRNLIHVHVQRLLL